MMPASILFAAMIGGYGAGAAGALAAPSSRIVRLLTALGAGVGSAAGLALAGVVLATRAPFELVVPHLLSGAGGVAIRLDPLGAIFLFTVGLVALPVAVYGFEYSASYEGRHSLRWLGLMLNLFLFSMSLVACADNVLTFLLLWEAMSLASYFLVLTERDRGETVRAAHWYLAMTHAGFVLIMASFLLMAGGQAGLRFADLRAGAGALAPSIRHAAFLCALAGFGSKAGMIPLHVWLPRAHPAAPSHVSALMSGVMIKLGVYGLLRASLDLLGGGPTWWGAVVVGIGAVSAVLGVLYALMEHDLKRLLAYHSAENIGIIFLGLGAGLMFQRRGVAPLAVLALAGALYHTVNHASFKALLFLGAGAVQQAAGTRNMERLGGLVKRMPTTAACFLVGAAAISALPPLNGFASEWLVFQALLGGARVPHSDVALVMPLAVGMLALSSGLAAACFVKAFGITFLAMPRSAEAEHAREAPQSMRLAMIGLAVSCLALGVLPFGVVRVLGGALEGVAGLAVTTPLSAGISLVVPGEFGAMSPPLVAVGLVAILGLTVLGLRLGAPRRSVRLSDTWGCGRVGQTARMEYTASSFAEPLRRVFAELYRPTHDLTVDVHPDSRYFIKGIKYRSEIPAVFEQVLYRPFVSLVQVVALQVRRLQAGSVHLYLLYLSVALVALLVIARWFA